MNFTISKSSDILNLYEYSYSSELISKCDEYTVHMISKIKKNNPMNEIVNILFYDKNIKKTPEEITIDTELSEIIDITFFTEKSQRDEELLTKLNIIEHEEKISIDIASRCITGNNIKIERNINLSWKIDDKAIYILFSDFNKNIHSYYIGTNIKILLNENFDIQGIIFVFER